MSLDVRARFRLTGLLTTAKMAAAIERGLVKAFLFDVEPLARDLSPFDQGTNSRSITHSVKGKTAEIHTESGYGGWLEVGTARMPARPYLRPAIERSREKIAARIKKEL